MAQAKVENIHAWGLGSVVKFVKTWIPFSDTGLKKRGGVESVSKAGLEVQASLEYTAILLKNRETLWS